MPLTRTPDATLFFSIIFYSIAGSCPSCASSAPWLRSWSLRPRPWPRKQYDARQLYDAQHLSLQPRWLRSWSLRPRPSPRKQYDAQQLSLSPAGCGVGRCGRAPRHASSMMRGSYMMRSSYHCSMMRSSYHYHHHHHYSSMMRSSYHYHHHHHYSGMMRSTPAAVMSSRYHEQLS
jgi:hypothetical protein